MGKFADIAIAWGVFLLGVLAIFPYEMACWLIVVGIVCLLLYLGLDIYLKGD